MDSDLAQATYGDMPHLASLDYDLFEEPWEQSDFKKAWHDHQNIVIRDKKKKVIAYCFYSKNDEGGVEIIRIAVNQEYQLKGLGTKILQFILTNEKFLTFEATLRETNLAGQLFFKKLGFKCIKQLKDFFNDTHEDAYYFFLKKEAEKPILI